MRDEIRIALRESSKSIKIWICVIFQELETRIETQKQTLQARDESIKKLLEMLQSKGEGKTPTIQDITLLLQHKIAFLNYAKGVFPRPLIKLLAKKMEKLLFQFNSTFAYFFPPAIFKAKSESANNAKLG